MAVDISPFMNRIVSCIVNEVDRGRQLPVKLQASLLDNFSTSSSNGKMDKDVDNGLEAEFVKLHRW